MMIKLLLGSTAMVLLVSFSSSSSSSSLDVARLAWTLADEWDSRELIFLHGEGFDWMISFLVQQMSEAGIDRRPASVGLAWRSGPSCKAVLAVGLVKAGAGRVPPDDQVWRCGAWLLPEEERLNVALDLDSKIYLYNSTTRGEVVLHEVYATPKRKEPVRRWHSTWQLPGGTVEVASPKKRTMGGDKLVVKYV